MFQWLELKAALMRNDRRNGTDQVPLCPFVKRSGLMGIYVTTYTLQLFSR